MQISYFRQTDDSLATVLERTSKILKQHAFLVIGARSLEKSVGKIFYLQNPDWIEEIVRREKQVLGLLPSTLMISEEAGKVSVGILDAGILGQVARSAAVKTLAGKAERVLKSVVEEIAQVGPPRPTEIKLYATTSCPYCKMEEAWLTEQKIPFTLVQVDRSPDAAQEMVNKTGQMGVPVTEISYDGQEPEYLIGFDKQRLSQLLLQA